MNQVLSAYPVTTILASCFYLLVLSAIFLRPVREWATRHLEVPVPSTKQHMTALDTIRGFAALIVVLGHDAFFCYPVFWSTVSEWLPYLGVAQKAVGVFTVLSGFLIYRSLLKVEDADGIRKFMVRRFWRIYPVYLLALVALAVIGRVGMSYDVIVAEVFMLASYYHPTMSNPAAWSLYVEVAFYVAAPVYVICTKGHRLAWALAGFLLFSTCDGHEGLHRAFWLLKYFFAGFIASELYDRLAEHKHKEVIGLVLCGIGLRMILKETRDSDWAVDWKLAKPNPFRFTVGLGLTMIVTILGITLSKYAAMVLSWRPLRIIGNISYSLFILHLVYLYLLFPEIDNKLVGAGPEIVKSVKPVAAWFMPLVLAPAQLVMAMASFVLVEKPLMMFGRR
jgi:peptidoglycan/LPS O-acetylase OafA/YrhL